MAAINIYNDIAELIKDYYKQPVDDYLNQTITIGESSLTCDIYRVESDSSLTSEIFTGCTAVDANTQIIIGKNLKVESEVTLTPPYRCKGVFIGDVGTFTNDGTLSMTARGANATGVDIPLVNNYLITAIGGSGGASSTDAIGKIGQTPSTFSCSGGGSGGSSRTGHPSGTGGSGTSFSGGTGGGGSGYNNGTNGAANGGAGGSGGAHSSGYGDNNGGGAGNPGGAGGGSEGATSANTGKEGTGGLLVLMCSKIIQNGLVASNGSNGGNGNASGGLLTGGGGSGAGCILLFSKQGITSTGTYEVSGGAGGTATGGSPGRAGGAGGTGVYDALTVPSMILFEPPQLSLGITYDQYVNDIELEDGKLLGLIDRDELRYKYDGKLHRAMDTDMSFEDFDLPTGKVPSGHGNPVGTIINFFGESAPDGYLDCDGTAYNIADYPTLAAHLLSFTDPTPYEVDGDDTKFKVPDLRGEFLRGSGTNSHTNQGSGANVGVHQDGTELPDIGTETNGNIVLKRGGGYGFYALNKDSYVGDSNNNKRSATTTQTSMGDSQNIAFTIRPTNTSILYCIKY